MWGRDSFNFRVQRFDAGEIPEKIRAKLGDASGSFSRPMGIGVDSDGNIYVIDSAFKSTFKYSTIMGKLLLWEQMPAPKTGEFFMPSGLYNPIARQNLCI